MTVNLTFTKADLFHLEWKPYPKLCSPRRHVGAIGYGGGVLVVGGQTGNSALGTVDCMELGTQNWVPQVPLNQPRRGLALASLVYNGKQCIYAIGGMSKHIQRNPVIITISDVNAVFNTVERYNPDQRVWQSVASMTLKRGGVAAVTLNGDVFAIGGNDGDMTKSSVERYR